MPITFRCPCGERLQAADEDAGQSVQCPTCNDVVTAPSAGPTLAGRPSSAGRGDDAPVMQPARARGDESDEDEHPRRRRRDDDDDDRPSRRRRDRDEPQSLEGKVFNGSMVGGAVAMLIAVVWFVAGLFADIVFYYPPILFVIGLVGFIRGLINRK